jgi:lauroyl/myristoyl acyltransferase
MNEIDLAVAAAASITTGGVSTLATLKGLGVHIAYINQKLDGHGAAIQRAHERADALKAELEQIKRVLARLHPGKDFDH